MMHMNSSKCILNISGHLNARVVLILLAVLSISPATADDTYTGVWNCDDSGTYYIRQVGHIIYWYGESSPEDPAWSNIAMGATTDNGISINWWDVPKGKNLYKGTLELERKSSDELLAKSQTGGFGGKRWTRAPALKGVQSSTEGSSSGPDPYSDYAGRSYGSDFGKYTGVWYCDDGGIYYIRNEDRVVHWYGEKSPRDPAWSNIGLGNIEDDIIVMQWFDVPKGKNLYNGIVKLKPISDDELIAISETGGFGGKRWLRLMSTDILPQESAPNRSLDTEKSDYSIESITFADGRALQDGLLYCPGYNNSADLRFEVRWNKIEPPRGIQCSNKLDIRGQSPKDVPRTMQLAEPVNVPGSISYGVHYISIPIKIPGNLTPGDTYTIIATLWPSDSDCDSKWANNRMDVPMKLVRMSGNDLVLEIMRDVVYSKDRDGRYLTRAKVAVANFAGTEILKKIAIRGLLQSNSSVVLIGNLPPKKWIYADISIRTKSRPSGNVVMTVDPFDDVKELREDNNEEQKILTFVS